MVYNSYRILATVSNPSSLSDKTDYHITPTVHHHYHYIYLDRPVAKYADHLDSVLIVAWSPDGTRIASGDSDWRIHVWEVNTEKLLLIYSGHTDVVSTIAWSPTGNPIASGRKDGIVKIWQV